MEENERINEEGEERAETPCINSEYGTPTKEHLTPVHGRSSENLTIENSLYSNSRAEIDRLEGQNAEYREKLLRTIRERDLNEELLKNVQNQHKKEIDAQTRRIRELEVQMKTNSDRATAQEAHFNVTTREMTQKFQKELQQATKKAELADKDKNEAVVKYAMREGEMMKLREDVKVKENGLKQCREELEEVKRLQGQEHVDGLEKMVNNLKVEVEKLKHEKFEVENRMKIAEKRVETLTTSLSESKQQSEVLRKQLIQAKDEKSSQQQAKLASTTADLERRLQEADSNLERLRTSQLDMATKFEEASRENTDLLSKIDILQDQLGLEEDRRKLCEEQIERLKGVESFVESSSHQIEESQKERETAEEDRVQAEQEAKECREHAEKMLRLTQELTERNMELQMKWKTEQEKSDEMMGKVEELSGELKSALEASKSLEHKNLELLEQIKRLEKEAEKPVTLESIEENFYRNKFEEVNKKLEEIENLWTEEKNNFSAYKKKTHANIKELRAELSRKTPSSGTDVLAPPCSSDPSISDRSRASSITSIDRVTSTSREEEQDDAKRLEQKEQQEQQKNMQQIMIDKIVILQRKLARRTEKCEFLEEHVRQCLEELQKKTKIIQHFALREEASLLMPSDGSLEKLFANCEFVQVPILRKSSAYALMGAMFTTSGGEKKQSQVLTEVNSRLQAVLEDVIQKNIGMRSTVDSLTADNTRLSRENRLLSLSQVRSQQSQDSTAH